MRRALGAAALVVIAALALAALLRPPPASSEARFALADCRRAAPRAPGGAPLTGIEDLAALPDGRLLLSAHDRLGGGGPAGLFLLDPAEPDAEAAALPGTPADLRPHGIAIGPGGRLAFVNRAARGPEVVLGRLGPAGLSDVEVLRGADLCRANDLAFVGGRLYATLDRVGCGIALADLLPEAATGRVVQLGEGPTRTVMEGLVFPNGIASVGGRLVVAETRADRLHDPEGVVPLPGGPDNLTATEDGALLAALHPHLLRLALRRAGAPLRTPSRIVRVASGSVEVLFDDPNGALFSGASAAVMAGGQLFAGSAYDAGLLICGEAV